VNWLETNEKYMPDAVMRLQPTTPLRTVKHIDKAIVKFVKQDVDCLVSVSEPQEHPMEMVYFKDKKMRFTLERKEEIDTRQEYPKYYFLNGAIYITKIDVLMKHKTFWGGRVEPYFIDIIDSIDVDTTADLIIADCLLRRRNMQEGQKS